MTWRTIFKREPARRQFAGQGTDAICAPAMTCAQGIEKSQLSSDDLEIVGCIVDPVALLLCSSFLVLQSLPFD